MAANCHESPSAKVADVIVTSIRNFQRLVKAMQQIMNAMPSVAGMKVADPKTILGRPEVPISVLSPDPRLEAYRFQDSKDYIIPPASLAEQIKC